MFYFSCLLLKYLYSRLLRNTSVYASPKALSIILSQQTQILFFKTYPEENMQWMFFMLTLYFITSVVVLHSCEKFCPEKFVVSRICYAFSKSIPDYIIFVSTACPNHPRYGSLSEVKWNILRTYLMTRILCYSNVFLLK